MRRDMRYVKQYLEQNAAAEAAATLDAAREAKDSTGAGDGGKGLDSDGDDQEYAKAAVLPWWLPPEKIPAQYSGEWMCGWVVARVEFLCVWSGEHELVTKISSSMGSSAPRPLPDTCCVAPRPHPTLPAVERSSGAVLHGKTSPINRKRVLSEAAAGQPPVWVCVEQYSVLFTIAGPPPSRWGSLLAGRSPASCAQRRELHAVLAGRALASCWLDAQVAPPRVASLCASAASCGACCAPPQRRPRRPCLSMPPRRSLWCRHAGTAASRVSSSARPATRCCCSPVTGRRRERARSLWPPSWRRRCRCGGAAPGRGAAASWRLLRAAGRAPAAAGGVCVQRGAACVACQPGPARS